MALESFPKMLQDKPVKEKRATDGDATGIFIREESVCFSAGDFSGWESMKGLLRFTDDRLDEPTLQESEWNPSM